MLPAERISTKDVICCPRPKRDAAHDDARRRGGHGDARHVAAARRHGEEQRLDAFLESLPLGFLVQDGEDDRLPEHDERQHHDGPEYGQFGGVLEDHQFVEKHPDGDEEVQALAHRFPEGRQLGFGQAAQAELAGFDVGDPQKARIGRERRNGRRLGDFDVRDVDVFRDDERGSAHDRRGELAVDGEATSTAAALCAG